jgi:hypothetical protein
MKPEDFTKKHCPVTCKPTKGEDVARLEDIVRHVNEYCARAADTVSCVHARTEGDQFVMTPLGLALDRKWKAKIVGFSLCPHCVREAADDLRQAAQCLEDLSAEVEKHDATNEKFEI